jgi:hypothetical protein
MIDAGNYVSQFPSCMSIGQFLTNRLVMDLDSADMVDDLFTVRRIRVIIAREWNSRENMEPCRLNLYPVALVGHAFSANQ